MTHSFIAMSLGLLLFSTAAQADVAPPRYFGAKPGSLAGAKQRLAAGDKTLAKALKQLVEEADEALKVKPPSVMEKDKVPPTGDKHDYVSRAPYFWPDPAKRDGLPYLRKDGNVNPESRDPRANDSVRLKLMADSVESLALAFFFTGKEAYAAHAARIARAWFLDPATRMNPHLRYAQAVPGRNDGRGTGIIEGRHLAETADALGLLAGSKAWIAPDRQALKAWLNSYLDWLLTNDNARDERAAKNNHGSFFDSQAARIALCLGRNDLARDILEEARQKRIAMQIESDGRQPLELERAASFGYSRFNLRALCDLATLGEHAGVDLWHFQAADGRGIRRALDFLVPFVDKPAKKWPYPQIKDMQAEDLLPVLRQAALAYDAPAYEKIIGKYSDARSKRFQLLFLK